MLKSSLWNKPATRYKHVDGMTIRNSASVPNQLIFSTPEWSRSTFGSVTEYSSIRDRELENRAVRYPPRCKTLHALACNERTRVAVECAGPSPCKTFGTNLAGLSKWFLFVVVKTAPPRSVILFGSSRKMTPRNCNTEYRYATLKSGFTRNSYTVQSGYLTVECLQQIVSCNVLGIENCQ